MDEVEAWRTALLEVAAHDLRSPLAGIRAHAETLLERDADLTDEQRTLFLRRIVETSDRLSGLLDDLLDLDRVGRGALALRPVPVALGELVREVLARLAVPAGHHVDVVDDDAPPVLADPRHLDRVVGELLDNAVAHTPSGTTVTATVDGHGDGARLVVEDDGPGLPDAVRGRLFVPFVSHPTTGADDRHRGVGLGLVDLVVRQHGGTVHHEDRPGGGSRFVVQLPGTGGTGP